MNYQESLELLQQVCNDLLNSQHHRSIAFAAKPKIEEALITFNKCIEEAKDIPKLRDKVDSQCEKIAGQQDTINCLQQEVNDLRSTHLAAEHGKDFEVLEATLESGGWIENNGHPPTENKVDLIFKSGGQYYDVSPLQYDWFLDDSKVFDPIKYWRLSNDEA